VLWAVTLSAKALQLPDLVCWALSNAEQNDVVTAEVSHGRRTAAFSATTTTNNPAE